MMYHKDEKRSKSKVDKSPYMRRSEKDTDKAFKSVEKGVKSVAKDTNKTRRKETRARIVGATVKKEPPASHLKRDMRKNMGGK